MLRDDVFRSATPAFQQQQASYWSKQQAETQPACRVLPKSAKEVAAAYLIAAVFHCNFAVKGGGHAAFAGASSIHQGITIDLQNLNSTNVNSNRNVTQVGAGNRWIDVYQYLTPKHLAVVGGRVSDIGVSGLTLGGFLHSSYLFVSRPDSLQEASLTSLDAAAGLVMELSITKYERFDSFFLPG